MRGSTDFASDSNSFGFGLGGSLQEAGIGARGRVRAAGVLQDDPRRVLRRANALGHGLAAQLCNVAKQYGSDDSLHESSTPVVSRLIRSATHQLGEEAADKGVAGTVGVDDLLGRNRQDRVLSQLAVLDHQSRQVALRDNDHARPVGVNLSDGGDLERDLANVVRLMHNPKGT